MQHRQIHGHLPVSSQGHFGASHSMHAQNNYTLLSILIVVAYEMNFLRTTRTTIKGQAIPDKKFNMVQQTLCLIHGECK